jgi:hypothetical protein
VGHDPLQVLDPDRDDPSGPDRPDGHHWPVAQRDARRRRDGDIVRERGQRSQDRRHRRFAIEADRLGARPKRDEPLRGRMHPRDRDARHLGGDRVAEFRGDEQRSAARDVVAQLVEHVGREVVEPSGDDPGILRESPVRPGARYCGNGLKAHVHPGFPGHAGRDAGGSAFDARDGSVRHRRRA